MQLTVISPDGVLFRGEVQKASLPAEQGTITILPGHMTLATSLQKGMIAYLPVELPESTLQSFADHSEKIAIVWWMAMIEEDQITVTAD